MAAVHRCFSKPVIGVFSLLTAAALSGCAGTSSMLGGGEGLRLTTIEDTQPAKMVEPAKKNILAPLFKSSILEPKKEVRIVSGPVITPVSDRQRTSAWCDYLREDAAAQSTIMRSPTVSGSLSEDASASVSVGVSLSSFAKADLVEESAEARCRKSLAEGGLQKLIFVSPQGLTAAGHKARFRHIDKQKPEIARLRNKARLAMENGTADRERTTAIELLADSIFADAAESRSQADRRFETGLLPKGRDDNARVLGRELLMAEAELEDINSRMRTFDAMDVTLSAGVSDDLNKDGVDINEDSFSGKLSFSVKLGALAPKRFEHEAAAKEAKLRAIQDQEGGTLWQVGVLRRAHERAIAGLVEQQQKLAEAIAKADKLAKMLASVDNPEFEPPLIQAKLQLIRLRADRAAVADSIAEIQGNMKRLKTG